MRMITLEELQAELAKIHALAGNTCVLIEGITWGATAMHREAKLREPANPPPLWLRTPPSEEGYWWWWNEDGPPIPVNIEVSLTDGPRYFATQGQYGWNRAQWVEDMGGMWMRLPEPQTPEPDAPMQKWSQTCRGCGSVETWGAKDFFDAADKLPAGWGYDQLLKGPVCPKCKA